MLDFEANFLKTHFLENPIYHISYHISDMKIVEIVDNSALTILMAKTILAILMVVCLASA